MANKQEAFYILYLHSFSRFFGFEVDARGDVQSHAAFSDVNELPSIARELPLVVLLPGQQIKSKLVKLPKTSRQNQRKALPYLLEDSVAGDVLDLHIIAGKTNADERALALAIDNSVFKSYFEWLAAHDLAPISVIPDYLAIAPNDAAWVFAQVGESVLVRENDVDGFSVGSSQLKLVLSLRDQQPVMMDYQLMSLDGQSVALDFPEGLTQQGEVKSLQFDPTIVHAKSPFNFLQDEYRVRHKASKQKSYWPWVKYSLVIWLAVVLGSQFVEWGIYHHHNKQLQSKVTALYQSMFPGASSDIDSMKSMIQHSLAQAAQTKQQDKCTSLLSAVGSVLQQHSMVQLNSFDYQHEQLSIAVQAAKLSDLESFSRSLELRHLTIKSNQVSTGEKVVQDQLVLQEAQ